MLSHLKKLLGLSNEKAAGASAAHGAAKAASEASQIAGRMIEDDASYSLVFVPGDASVHMGPLMDGLGYAPKRGTRMEAGFVEVWDLLLDTPTDQPDVVRKAWYRTDTHTVLIDPEMVTHLQIDVWKQLATMQGGTVVIAMWERVSRTVLLTEVNESGLVRRTSRIDGEVVEGEEVNPHAQVVASANADGLRKALASMGIVVDAKWSLMQAEVIEMQSK